MKKQIIIKSHGDGKSTFFIPQGMTGRQFIRFKKANAKAVLAAKASPEGTITEIENGSESDTTEGDRFTRSGGM